MFIHRKWYFVGKTHRGVHIKMYPSASYDIWDCIMAAILKPNRELTALTRCISFITATDWNTQKGGNGFTF